MMGVHEIRKIFLEFFRKRGHRIVESSGLVPTGDPTLFFTSAGMVQFKKLWSGEVALPYQRAASCQKCLRASDLEKVGKSAKYMTFFEMLGNFSFGEYFKQEAIEWAWEFVTEVVKLPKEKLYISVLDEDDEAYKNWRSILEEERIYKLGKGENFWSPAGGRGACGPCSEVFYDMGEDVGCGRPGCKPGCECDRWVEIWNLVFPQYDAQPDSTLKLLKNKGIDTGMGLERFSMAVQGKKSVFELEFFKPIIEETEGIFGIGYEENKIAFNIIADHIRALTFAIAEGIYPSNIGRGYLLRHLLRRAQSQAYELGVKKPFLYKLVGVVVDITRDSYSGLVGRREGVALVVKSEEESFLRTLEQGTRVFNEVIYRLKSREIPGEDIFKLYDTYGFPPELTYELAKRKGFESDKSGFERIMERQRERARLAFKFDGEKGEWQEFFKCERTEIVGYDNLWCEAKIAKWRGVGNKFEVMLDRSPFYAESGGQVGDKGRIFNKDLEFIVHGTRNIGEIWLHIGELKRGDINMGKVMCEVDKLRRRSIERNHTATHLLHAGLRKTLGNWVHQEGSLVEAERFRFDFTHFKSLEPYEIEKVEELINSWILDNIKVETYLTSFEEAVKEGTMAIFGEKYGEWVRVVRIGDISRELCGGTHVNSTGEIGILKIMSETGVHAGIRRVEVITGTYASEWLRRCERDLVSISESLGVEPLKAKEKVSELLGSESKLRDEVAQLERAQILGLASEILSKKKRVRGIDVLTGKIPTESIENLRVLADKLRAGKKRAGILGAIINEKPAFITFVSDDLKGVIRASTLAQEVGKLAGGGGGGKDTLGQAGGKDPEKLGLVLNKFPEIIAKFCK